MINKVLLLLSLLLLPGCENSVQDEILGKTHKQVIDYLMRSNYQYTDTNFVNHADLIGRQIEVKY
ncbi:MAG: hypothetical protein Q8896_09900, partial [Bacteroidota bacterium]|nr:hypothetical protein [Bacteroidota bacterium]